MKVRNMECCKDQDLIYIGNDFTRDGYYIENFFCDVCEVRFVSVYKLVETKKVLPDAHKTANLNK